MSTTILTAATVMDRAASLMNDTAKTTYTYVAQLPYLNMAADELEESFELNNVPITNQTSAVIEVPVGTTIINPTSGWPTSAVNATPYYPDDLIEIQQLWERLNGTTDSFIPMTRDEFLKHIFDDLPVDSLIWWIWQDQRIKLIGALTAREVKVDYIKALIPNELTASSTIGIINARSFLYYRTAALCSQFIGENKTRADELNAFAILALDRSMGISTKGRQAITNRRRPFMASYKSRGF